MLTLVQQIRGHVARASFEIRVCQIKKEAQTASPELAEELEIRGTTESVMIYRKKALNGEDNNVED